LAHLQRKNKRLAEQLNIYKVLDRYIKKENKKLKATVVKLQTQVDEVIGTNKMLSKQLQKIEKNLKELIDLREAQK